MSQNSCRPYFYSRNVGTGPKITPNHGYVPKGPFCWNEVQCNADAMWKEFGALTMYAYSECQSIHSIHLFKLIRFELLEGISHYSSLLCHCPIEIRVCYVLSLLLLVRSFFRYGDCDSTAAICGVVISKRGRGPSFLKINQLLPELTTV